MGLPSIAFVRRPLAVLLLAGASAVLVAGCAAQNQTVNDKGLSCPKVGFVAQLTEMTNFAPGPGRDLTDIDSHARLIDYTGTCTYDKEDGQEWLTVDVDLTLEGELGPHATSSTVQVPYVVAVVAPDDTIIAQQDFTTPVTVDQGGRQQRVVDQIEQRLPLGKREQGQNLRVLIGLKLTPEQLEFNKSTAVLR